MRKLPSLNGLRTFEAAARLGSFRDAARELFVTQGAVSRGVQALEDWLGAELFTRHGRRVELTARGRAYMLEIGAALDRLALATARAAEGRDAAVVHVDGLPTLTMRWLIPRLPRFQAREPGSEIRLTTSDRPVTSATEGFDVAIRRGPEPWRGLVATRFLEEHATPVCAPAVAARLRGPEALARATWLHADTRPSAWKDWLAKHRLAKLHPARALHFDHFYLALQAAQGGLGVAMGPRPIVDEDLAAGRLVAPFPELTVSARSYFALVRRGRPSRAVQAFVAWLREEGAAPGP